MSGSDAEKTDAQDLIQWAEALRWLAKADEDIAVAEMALSAMPGQAGFHVQQAPEKTLKGLLIAKQQDIRKTHEIRLLAALVRPHWPDLIPEPFTLVQLSEWYLSSRYPELDETNPTTDEVTEALTGVKAFMTTVCHHVPHKLKRDLIRKP